MNKSVQTKCLLPAGRASWSQPSSSCGTGADRRMGHSVCYDPQSKVIFVYGGSKNKRWFNDVHKLDTTTWTWAALKVTDHVISTGNK